MILKALFLSLVVLISFCSFAVNAQEDTSEIAQDVPQESLPEASKWSLLIPGFVVHGLTPGASIAEYMPRKMDKKGQSVLTPGIGAEYQSDASSYNFLTALLKDCYDNYAGTILFGQNWKVGERFSAGYLAGLYIRGTPITCYTSTTVTSSAINLPIHLPGSRPSNQNMFTSESCQFSDNLPIRYTFKSGDGYIDVIPSPFIKMAYKLYDGQSLKVSLTFLSNIYLNEFGLSIPL